MRKAQQTFRSPIGTITVTASRRGIEEVVIGKLSATKKNAKNSDEPPCKHAEKILKRTKNALEDYFAGNGDALKNLPLSFGGTPFQQKVLKCLCRIKPGKVLTYGEIAKATGHPGAARAVGSVCAKNRLPLVIPCHRVVASSRGLGGYSCGLPRKRKLLNLEGVRDLRG